MGVFLILMVWFSGMPAFDFRVFQNMQDCLKVKEQIAENLKEDGINVILLECKSNPGDKQAAAR